jgi:hypothetical protein
VGTFLEPLAASTTFIPNSGGYVVPVTVTVPGVPAGRPAAIILDVELPVGTADQLFGPWEVTLGGDGSPLPRLQIGQTALYVPADCPEPVTCLLSVVGGIVLWLARDRTGNGTHSFAALRARVCLPNRCGCASTVITQLGEGKNSAKSAASRHFVTASAASALSARRSATGNPTR